MSKYTSKKEKVREILDNDVKKALENKADLKYYELVEFLSFETGASIDQVKEILKQYFKNKIFKEIRHISLENKGLEKNRNWLQNQIRYKEQTQEDIKEVLG